MDLKQLLGYFVVTFSGTCLVWLGFSWFFPWWVLLGSLIPLSVVAWTLAYFVYDRNNQETVDAHGKAVLITGCDTGFGHKLALQLDKLGYNVFAGVLTVDGEGAQTLRDNGSSRLRVLQMNVTKPDEVTKAVDAVTESGLPLWAVVNNAGIGVFCPFEWGHDIDEFRNTYEVNVFGMVRVTKHCIPLLRKSKGRIVNVASLAGRITAPGIGHYCMSKFSVRSFSDLLRRELYPDPIKVITLEPTFYRTEIINRERLAETRAKIFERTPESIKQSLTTDHATINGGMEAASSLVSDIARNDLGEVVAAMQSAVTLRYPKLFYRCCGYPDLVLWAIAQLPETLLDSIVVHAIHNRFCRAGLTFLGKALAKIEGN